jgi:hypothetical protein
MAPPGHREAALGGADDGGFERRQRRPSTTLLKPPQARGRDTAGESDDLHRTIAFARSFRTSCVDSVPTARIAPIPTTRAPLHGDVGRAACGAAAATPAWTSEAAAEAPHSRARGRPANAGRLPKPPPARGSAGADGAAATGIAGAAGSAASVGAAAEAPPAEGSLLHATMAATSSTPTPGSARPTPR